MISNNKHVSDNTSRVFCSIIIKKNIIILKKKENKSVLGKLLVVHLV